jgi:hypothetical protein
MDSEQFDYYIYCGNKTRRCSEEVLVAPQVEETREVGMVEVQMSKDTSRNLPLCYTEHGRL